jgi:hypothetical protein
MPLDQQVGDTGGGEEERGGQPHETASGDQYGHLLIGHGRVLSRTVVRIAAARVPSRFTDPPVVSRFTITGR